MGEDLVTNPEALSVPEGILLSDNSSEILATSNLVSPGELLLDGLKKYELRDHLEIIHEEFAKLYEPEPGEPFAMEIEFKITRNNLLSTKQARPWVFNVAIPPSDNIFATGKPITSGTIQVGETLPSDVSGITDEDGLDNAAFSYQWVSKDGSTDTDIPGAVASTYTVSDGVVGRTLRVRVSFTDDAGNSETPISQRTDAVAHPNQVATGLPRISGTVQAGETLTADGSGIADPGGLGDATFSYQWISDDGSTETGIEGATEVTYFLTSNDV